MTRYPKAARAASIKCIPCNAPATRTVQNQYVCVKCGKSPIANKAIKRKNAVKANGD